MTTGLTNANRFKRSHPCPICGGYDMAPKGKGLRCWGFLSTTGKVALCTRDEYAGTLQLNQASQTYAHRLDGDCKCGGAHNPRPISTFSSEPSRAGRRPGVYTRAGRLKEVKAYSYRDASGEVVHETVRFEPKAFKQRAPDGFDGWVWSLKGVKTVLYRLPELLALPKGSLVFIVEGEKDADNLAALGLNATTNAMGAGKWRTHYSPFLAGHHVVIIPDNDADDTGRRHAVQVAISVQGHAESVKCLPMPEGAKDVSVWLGLGHTQEELLALVEAAVLWTQEPPVTDLGPLPQEPGQDAPAKRLQEENLFARREWRKQHMASRLLEEGTKLDVQGKELPLYVQLRTLTLLLDMAPTNKELKPLIAPWLETRPMAFEQRYDDCGTHHGDFCGDHGNRKGGQAWCEFGFDGGCLTRIGERIAMATLPTLTEAEKSYYYVAVRVPWDIPQRLSEDTGPEYAEYIKEAIGVEMEMWNDAVNKLINRKRFRGGYTARVFQQTLTSSRNFWLGWVVYEEGPGRAAGPEFAKALLELIPGAQLKVSAPGYSGETLAMVIMLLSRSWLIAFNLNSYAFEGAFDAHSKRRMFQSGGALQKALEDEQKQSEEAKAGKPPFDKEAPHGKCDVTGCGRTLFRRHMPEGMDPATLTIGAKPEWASSRWAAPKPAAPPAPAQGRF